MPARRPRADGAQPGPGDAQRRPGAILLGPAQADALKGRRAFLDVAALEQAAEHRVAGGGREVLGRRRQPERMLAGLGEDAEGSVGKGHVRGSRCSARSAGCYEPEPRREAGQGSALAMTVARAQPFVPRLAEVKRE